MSDAKEPDQAAPPPSPPRSGGSKLVPLLLVLNLGATGFVVFKTLTAAPAEAAASHEKAAPPPTPTAEVTGPIAPVDPFVVNLDEPGAPRYLKLTIQLEMKDKDAVEVLDHAKQPVRDQVLGYLSNLKVADTLGEANKQKIRDGLLARIDKVVGKDRVRRMFFSEFVVQ